MLAELRRRHPDSRRGLTHVHRAGHDLHRSVVRVVIGEKKVVGPGLGIVNNLNQGLDRRCRQVRQERSPFFEGSGQKGLSENMVEFLSVFLPGLQGGKPGVRFQFLTADQFTEFGPIAVRLQGIKTDQFPVLGPIGIGQGIGQAFPVKIGQTLDGAPGIVNERVPLLPFLFRPFEGPRAGIPFHPAPWSRLPRRQRLTGKAR